MKRCLACLTILAIAVTADAVTPGALVFAASSANGPPPAANKEGGVEGDPRGAIRALGGTSQNDFQEQNNKVDVPKLGGGAGAGQVGGAPAGTNGGR